MKEGGREIERKGETKTDGDSETALDRQTRE